MKKREEEKKSDARRTHSDMWTKILYMARGGYFLLYTLILVLVVFFRNTMQYVWEAENKNPLFPEWGMLLLAAGVMAGGILLCSKYHRQLESWCEKYAKVITAAGTILLFCAQLYISYLIYFSPGWDSGLLVNFAEHKEAGRIKEILDDASGYYSLAPNNIMLTLIFEQLIHFSRLTGIFTENSSLMMLIFVQCLISSLAVYLVYQCVRKVTQSDTAAFVGWITAVFFVGLSPWMVFPYSDATGMLFPILIASVYILWGESKLPLKWMMIAGISVLGYHIKPQTAIIFLAILIVEGLRILNERKAWRQRLLCLAAAVLAAGGTYYACGKIMDSFKAEIDFDAEASFGILHYAMLGLNEENNGMYSFGDVEYSMSFDTMEERNQGNILKIKERIIQFGPVGLLKHWAKKTIGNYGDATFGWGGQGGGFYIEIFPEKNERICPLLRSVYYSDGEYFPLYFTARQMCWLLMLLLMGGAALSSRMSKADAGVDVLMIAIIGLTLFELIFEAHAKYLYTHAPVFVMLAVIGAYRYFRLTERTLQKIKQNRRDE